MTTDAPSLPAQMQVFVRDWLSSNNILLRSDDGHVLIDSGYTRHAPMTLALLGSRAGIGEAPLARLVNTHCHSDHMGGNAAIQARYACKVVLPEGEAAVIERWDDTALLLSYCDQRCEPFTFDEVLRPGDTPIWGGLEWEAHAAPGHDMRAMVFYNPEHRILVSGDALWANGYGFVMPPAVDPDALPAAQATLAMLASLDIRCVIPGHGDPFDDVAAALERAFHRTEAFVRDPQRMALHGLKVVLMFALLDQRRLPLSALPGYVARIGIYRDLNAHYFRLAPQALADLLVAGLERAGAVRREDDSVVPA